MMLGERLSNRMEDTMNQALVRLKYGHLFGIVLPSMGRSSYFWRRAADCIIISDPYSMHYGEFPVWMVSTRKNITILGLQGSGQ